MYNLLIVEDDLIQAHRFTNSISENFSDIKVYSVATLGKDAIDIIKKQVVDIILLDLKLPDISGIDILNYISDNKIEKYYKSIIVITGEMSLLPKIVHNPYIFDYKSKISINNNLLETIEKLLYSKNIDYKETTHNNSYTIKEEINSELHKIKYNFSYIGTKYLSDCIYEVYLRKDKYNINLKQDIYPTISKKYHKTVNNIKTNINRSTNNMYFDCEEKVLSEYFGYTLDTKPNIKDIILQVIKHL